MSQKPLTDEERAAHRNFCAKYFGYGYYDNKHKTRKVFNTTEDSLLDAIDMKRELERRAKSRPN